MFDILLCKPNKDPEEYGFAKFYGYAEIKQRINKITGLADAANYKNKKVLLVLEDYFIEEGALRIIGEKNEACFLIDLSRIIKNKGVPKALELSRVRSFLVFCKKYKVGYALASFASEEQSIRTARELIHIGFLLGLTTAESKNALRRISEYLD